MRFAGVTPHGNARLLLFRQAMLMISLRIYTGKSDFTNESIGMPFASDTVNRLPWMVKVFTRSRDAR